MSLFRYFEVGLRVCDIVVKKFTFAISSPDEFLLLFTFVPIFVKIHQELRAWECTQTDTRTEANWFYNMPHTIYYSHGTENNSLVGECSRAKIWTPAAERVGALLLSYKKRNMSVYLILMHGHSFERICMKFGTWNPYTLRTVTGAPLAPMGSRSARRHFAAANHCRSCTSD